MSHSRIATMSSHDTAKSGLERPGCGRDARGQPITMLDPYTLHLLRRHDVIPAERLQRIARRLGPGLPTWQRRAYLVCVVLFFGCLATLFVRKILIGTGLRFDLVERFLWPINIALFSFSAYMVWRSAAHTRLKRARQVMLDHRRCPQCGYDLRGLPPDPRDGATVCPECGAAWRLSLSHPDDQP